MKLQKQELIDRVIAEYVLGTLSGPARHRCESWLANAQLVDQRRRFWEENLMYLAQAAGCPGPPAHVWSSIRQRLKLPGA